MELIVEELSHILHIPSILRVLPVGIIRFYALGLEFYLQENPMCIQDVDWCKQLLERIDAVLVAVKLTSHKCTN